MAALLALAGCGIDGPPVSPSQAKANAEAKAKTDAGSGPRVTVSGELAAGVTTAK